MPDLPDTDDVTDEATGAVTDGVVHALGTGIGQQAAGGIGHAIGGVVAGASIGGQKGETLSTLAVSNGIRSSLMGAGGNRGGGRRTK